MTTFYIQEQETTNALTRVSHDEFYETLNDGSGYLYYKQGGRHIAMLPTAMNEETIRVCNQADYAERDSGFADSRCRDVKGQPCRYQHDDADQIIHNAKGNAVHAKCGDCPRNGWIGGKRVNCCIRNICKIEDCAMCTRHREYNGSISFDWLSEDKYDDGDGDGGGFFIEAPDADIQAALENEELRAVLHIAVGKLPPPEKAIIKAIYWDRLSRRAFAIESGMAHGTEAT
jgi:hypothetical protein